MLTGATLDKWLTKVGWSRARMASRARVHRTTVNRWCGMAKIGGLREIAIRTVMQAHERRQKGRE